MKTSVPLGFFDCSLSDRDRNDCGNAPATGRDERDRAVRGSVVDDVRQLGAHVARAEVLSFEGHDSSVPGSNLEYIGVHKCHCWSGRREAAHHDKPGARHVPPPALTPFLRGLRGPAETVRKSLRDLPDPRSAGTPEEALRRSRPPIWPLRSPRSLVCQVQHPHARRGSPSPSRSEGGCVPRERLVHVETRQPAGQHSGHGPSRLGWLGAAVTGRRQAPPRLE